MDQVGRRVHEVPVRVDPVHCDCERDTRGPCGRDAGLSGRCPGRGSLTRDEELENSVRSVVKRFGGDFSITTGVRWKDLLRHFEGTSVHLTMYGTHIDDALPRIRSAMSEKMLIVVGAEKVPPEVYQWATFNVGVGNQPHSEVAALAVFLDRLKGGEGLRTEFKGQMRVVPCERGKRVVNDTE